ncbi:hypothetical protein Efla_000648 [Eimeria flavescens]
MARRSAACWLQQQKHQQKKRQKKQQKKQQTLRSNQQLEIRKERVLKRRELQRAPQQISRLLPVTSQREQYQQQKKHPQQQQHRDCSAKPERMKLFACLFAAAAAAAAGAAAAANGNGDSPNATLHVGLEECITAANIVRAARLNTRLGLLERSPEMEKKANQTLDNQFNGNYSCKKMQKDDHESVTLTAYQDFFGYVFEGKDAKCLERMVKVVNKLLTDSPEYPPAYNEKVKPWDTEETQVAARVLWQTTKSAGCAYATGCPVSWLICTLSPKPEEGEYAFTKEVYEALLARRAAGVDVASLTAADIGQPLSSSSGVPWGFAALQCVLLGLLTAGGALVLAL